MDWQFKVGLGIAIVAIFIPYAFKDMPVALSYAGLVSGALFVLWGFLPGHSKIPLWPSIAIISCVSALVASGLWWKAAYLKQEHVEAQLSEQTHNESFDYKISFKCNFAVRPKFRNPNRSIYTIQLLDPASVLSAGDIRLSVALTSDSQGDGEIEYGPKDGVTLFYYKCTFRNESGQALYDMKIDYRLNWYENIKTETGNRIGPLKYSLDTTTSPFQIGASGQEEYFYIVNQNFMFADAVFSDIIRAKIAGTTEEIAIKLIPESGVLGRRAVLFPKMLPAPQVTTSIAEPRPTPTPP